MTHQKNILLIFGGGGNEHEISLLSKNHLKDSLSQFAQFNIIEVEITKNKKWVLQNNKQNFEVYLNSQKMLCYESTNQPHVTIDYAIPCIHGAPGETGQIQGLFEIYGIPFFGNNLEASAICMNKITTKLWLTSINVPIVEYLTLTSVENSMDIAKDFFKNHGKIFVKASSEGSSIGIFQIDQLDQLEAAVKQAFKFSPYVLLERAVSGREIEVSAYQYGDEINASKPGEIICPKGFYDYQEKYSKDSKTTTSVVAKNLSSEIIQQIQKESLKIFKCLKLKDLSRIDFFLEPSGKFYVNEINTFPGLTPISLFPQMMKENGHNFSTFLHLAISRDLMLRNTDQ